MGIQHISVVSIPVSDQERAKDFYVNSLGFEVENDMPADGDQRWIQVKPPNAETTLALVTWFPTMPPGSLKGLVLECDDIDQTYETLKANGVTFSSEPKTEFWGRYTTFDDPDGNEWTLRAEAP